MKEKKKFFSVEKILLTFALACLMTLAFGQQAKAATQQVTGVKQTGATAWSIDLEWDALQDNNVRYEVEVNRNKTSGLVVKCTVYGNRANLYFKDKIKAGSTYYVRVRAYINDVPGAYSSVLEVVTAPSSSTSAITHTKSTETSIGLSWKKVPGANMYVVKYGRCGAGFNTYKQKKVVGTSTTLTKLSKNREYVVYVYAARKASNNPLQAVATSYRGEAGLPVLPTKTTGVTCPYYPQEIGEVAMECNWKECADGYQWQLYTSYSGRDKCIKTVNSESNYTTIANSALRKHNFYKVRVRSYSLNSSNKKMYGAWSSWKYICPQPEVKMKSASSGLKVSWDKIKGADQYVVYVSNKPGSGYKKYTATRNTSTTIKKCGSSKLKSGKYYYVYVVAKNKVGRTYYSGEAGETNSWSIRYKK